MNDTTEKTPQPDKIHQVMLLLENSSLIEVNKTLLSLHPAEIAHLLESLPPEERKTVWGLVPEELHGSVLPHLNEDLRSLFVRKMDDGRLVALAEQLDTDDLADFLQDLPDDLAGDILQSMTSVDRTRLEAVFAYPEDCAGGLMNTDTVTVRADITLDVVMRYLRLHDELPETTDSLYVVNREGRYQGVLALATLVIKEQDLTVAEVMNRQAETILADTKAAEVASLFQRRDLVTAPVVDEEGLLLGRITIDDVVDVIRDEADHSLMSMAGLNEEEDMFSPVASSARRRTVWLGVNLLTALLASWVIGQFHESIEKLVALAVLMPVVASMGGIAGSQTLTLVVRGMALGQLGERNTRWLVMKELSVGVVNGLVWALVIAAIAIAWFGDLKLGGVIGLAILTNLVCAGLAGALIPLLLKKWGIDPALAGTVVLTTVTDVVGFLSFLGLATLLLL